MYHGGLPPVPKKVTRKRKFHDIILRTIIQSFEHDMVYGNILVSNGLE